MRMALEALGITDAPDEYQLRRSEGLREQLLWDVRARYLLLVSRKVGDEMAIEFLEKNYRACREGIARLGGGGF